MTDIKCPMCSKPNPEGTATCRYCGARLIPLGAPPTPASEDTPDWLRDLRGSQGQSASEAPAPAAANSDADVPDWLAQIRQKGQAPEESAATPDWLPDSSAGQPTPTKSDEPDWLSSLRGPETPAAENPPAAPAGETPDWLHNLTDQPAASVPPSSAASASTDNQDWLQNLQPWQPSQASEPTVQAPRQPADENSDWLADLQAGTTPPAGSSADWFDTTQAATPAQPTSPAADQDWLKDLESWSPDTQPVSAAETPAAAFGAGDETPDWLSGLPAQPAAETPAAAFGAGDETPDWLSGLPAQPAAETPAAAFGAGDETPDWLSGLPAQPAAETPAAGDSPDWLKAYAEEPIQEQPQASAAFPAEDIAEWLAPQGAETSGTTSPFVGAAGLGEGWGEGETTEAAATPAFSFDLPPTLQTPETEETPFHDEEIPDWLPSAQQQEAQTIEASTPEGISDGLTPAELPTWVAAMRPVESVAPIAALSPDDQQIERLGPLAGLKGTLPGQEAVIQYVKPPVYSVKLQVTDRQRLHSNLLEAMLSEEAQPHTVAHELTNKSARWFRLITALILIGALLIPLIFGGADNLPAAYSAPDSPASQLYMDISILGEGPVLLILDYEPGLSAELQIASLGIVQHLMEKSAHLVIVSANPTGPLLAENLLKEAIKGQTNYGINEMSVNMGYIPGGTTGLQTLVSDLRGTLRQPLRGNWENPALQNVHQLADFQQVFLLTGSDESARAWIEQIQPVLGATPLRVISSIQAAPMLQPYLDSGQIKNLVSGLTGGAAYQKLRQSPYPNNGYWSAYFNAYQTGMAVAVAMIVVGLLLRGTLAILNSTKKRKGA